VARLALMSLISRAAQVYDFGSRRSDPTLRITNGFHHPTLSRVAHKHFSHPAWRELNCSFCQSGVSVFALGMDRVGLRQHYMTHLIRVAMHGAQWQDGSSLKAPLPIIVARKCPQDMIF
jgi:hypothetical protein